MFTWICPQCGREVPPSYTECPNCSPEQQRPPASATPAPPPAARPAPSQPVSSTFSQPLVFSTTSYTLPASRPPAAPPPPPPPPQQAAPPQEYTPPPPHRPSTSPLFAEPAPPQAAYAAEAVPARKTLPTWLMSILFSLAFVGLVAGVYWAVQHFQGGRKPAATGAPVLENVPPAKPGAAASNPLQKYVEVTGVRLLQNAKKQTEARFVLVNHSSADAADLAGTVLLLGRTQKEGDEPVGRFSFKGVTLGPYESKELTAPVDTKLRVYELPDWQMTVTQLQVSAP